MLARQHLNLLDERIAPKPPRVGVPQALGLAAALFVLVFMISITLDTAAAHREQLTEQERAALARLAPQAPVEEPAGAAAAELEQLRVRLQSLQAALRQFEPDTLDTPQGHAELLQALSRQTPDAGIEQQALWLTGFTLHGRELSLQGRVLDASALPAYLHRLEQEPLFKGRSFEQLRIERLEDGHGSRFSLVAGAASTPRGAP